MNSKITCSTVFDPLSGKLSKDDIPEGEILYEDEHIYNFSQEDILGLDCLYDKHRTFTGPVSISFFDGKLEAVEAGSQLFDNFSDLCEKLRTKDCEVYCIIKNNSSGNYLLRYFKFDKGENFSKNIFLRKMYLKLSKLSNDEDFKFDDKKLMKYLYDNFEAYVQEK